MLDKKKNVTVNDFCYKIIVWLSIAIKRIWKFEFEKKKHSRTCLKVFKWENVVHVMSRIVK